MAKGWLCIKLEPETHAYGDMGINEVYNIVALVERQKSGKWLWSTKPHTMSGVEPSLNLAKDAAIYNMSLHNDELNHPYS